MPARGSAIPFACRTCRNSWDAPHLWLLKSLGRTVRPPLVRRKPFCGFADEGDGTDRAGNATRSQTCIDFSSSSNDSFIQLFELQLSERGPDMSSDRTRSAILAAAERLYADRGFGGVTLSELVSGAHVNYHAVN